MFFHRAVVNVLFFGMYFGSCAPLVFPPSDDKPNSIEPPPLLLKQCAKLPDVGQSEFRVLIEKYKCFVDKTQILYKIVIRDTQPFWFLSRPRRFGKTLLLSTLEQFFTGEAQLFQDTYIYSQYLGPYWPKHPVIRIDFSCGLNFKSSSSFEDSLVRELRHTAKLHDIDLDVKYVEEAIKQLISSVHKKYNQTVVILIDEYDSPYTRSFAENEELAAQMLGTLQNFYSTLKGVVAKIRFCFVTGITRISLSDFFSGANAAVDLSVDPEYSDIVGFTREQLTQYFGGFVEKVAVDKESSKENILKEMSKWHDGFRFTAKNLSLFSPISVIGYLRSGGDVRCYSHSGGESKFLVQRLKTFKLEALRLFVSSPVSEESDECDEEQKITAVLEELTGKINFDDSTDPVALKALLFHSGYLSIGDYNNETLHFTLRFSNLELKRDYARRFYFSCTRESPTNMIIRVNSSVRDLDVSRWESFISKLDSFHSSIPYYLNVNQRKGLEAWFQFTMYLAFHFSTYKNVGKPLMEDAPNKGRADITLPMNNKMYIFEPKMMGNPENPVYECKVKYPQKHFFRTMEEVVCIGLKFNQNGDIGSWGVATFSQEGKLTGESGKISLINPLSPEEKKKIESKLTDFRKEYSNFTLPTDKIIEFLTQIGPSTENELNFAKDFTTDIRSLCIFLGNIKNELQSNVKGIINGFLNRNDQ